MKKNPAGSIYRQLVRDAWSVVRDNPILWVFGFFVSFLGNGGVYELLIQGTGRLGLEQDFGGAAAAISLLPSGPELWQTLTALQGRAVVVVLLGLAAIGLFLVAVWAILSSQGALIQGIRDCARGKRHTFASLFTAGNEVVWPLLLLNVLSRMAITAFFYMMLSVLVLLLVRLTVITAIGYLLAFLVFVPLTIIAGFVTVYAAAYVTLYRMRLVDALESAFTLFKKHWLVSLETALMLFAINILTAFALGVGVAVLAVIVFAFYGFTAALTGAAAWILLLVGAVLALGMLVVTGAGLAAFEYAVWTELFLKLNKGGAVMAKLARWFQKLLP